MAKSSLSTKNLKEALTPDQVSKVEDKYKSIYSGMLKGDKKKLMKYIDPKLKRPNPDAMAMGRAINLVKKETETEPINEQMDAYDEIAQSEFGMDYEQLGAGEQEWVRDEIDNMELREELVNEENSYDSFKTDASERFLNRSQVVELLPVLKNSLRKLSFHPTKQPTLSIENYGLNSSNRGYVLGMRILTSKGEIIVELGKYPRDEKNDEVSISLYLPNEEGRLTQVAYETSTSPKGEELPEDSNVLSKVISMANQWYEKPDTIDERLTTMVREVYSEKQRKWACAQDEPKFDEMCKDTAISKKKLEEGIDFVKVASYFGMSWFEFYSKSPKVRKEMVERYKKDNTSLNEERTSTVSKARAKSELKQMLKGKRDDGMGKSTLKAVLAIDKDGKETKVKKLEDFDKFEKGTKFSLKETIMNNDRLTELIKSALAGPVKEDNFHSPRTVKNIPIGDEDEELTTVDLDWYEKKDEERSRKAGEDMRKNQNSLKEGVWSMGTVEEINRFIKDIKEMKNHYYDIVGSDDVFDGLDRAEMAAKELAMNAPENSGDFDETNESFDSLAKKLDKQKGIDKEEAAKIAGSIAAKKRAGAGKGPTAKQKKRMAESILKKLRG